VNEAIRRCKKAVSRSIFRFFIWKGEVTIVLPMVERYTTCPPITRAGTNTSSPSIMTNSNNKGSKRPNAEANEDRRDGSVSSDVTSNAIARSKRLSHRTTRIRRVDMAGNLEMSGQDVSTTKMIRSSSDSEKRPDPTRVSPADANQDSSIEARLERILKDHPDNERALWLAKKLNDRKKHAEMQRKEPTNRFSLSRTVESLGSASRLDIQSLYGNLIDSNAAPSEPTAEQRQKDQPPARDYRGLQQSPSAPNTSPPVVLTSIAEKVLPSDSHRDAGGDVGSQGGLIKLILSIEREYMREGGGSNGSRNVAVATSRESKWSTSQVKEVVDDGNALKGTAGPIESTVTGQPLQSDLENAYATEWTDVSPTVQSKLTSSRRPTGSSGEKLESNVRGAANNLAGHTFWWHGACVAVCFLAITAGTTALTLWILNRKGTIDLTSGD
jgi:hypothetical protein